jgi:hypothetical protein
MERANFDITGRCKVNSQSSRNNKGHKMPSTIRTLDIQRKLQQVTGGNPGSGEKSFNPGTLLHTAYNTGVFNFPCRGPPCRNFFKQPGCMARPANAMSELQFYFKIPEAHEESYRLVELLVDEFCKRARLYFSTKQPGPAKAAAHFRYQFTIDQVNKLMIHNNQSIRATECTTAMMITNGSTPLAIEN